MRRVRVQVVGRVQGVFFRVTCAERARTLGLTGWVRNTAEGSVETEFEGPADDVASMIQWCHEGPPGAAVRSVVVQELPVSGDTGFRITA